MALLTPNEIIDFCVLLFDDRSVFLFFWVQHFWVRKMFDKAIEPL